MRKIIQLIPGDATASHQALCDDGTLWKLVGDKWMQKPLPAIPQVTAFSVFKASDYLTDPETLIAYLTVAIEDENTDIELLKSMVRSAMEALNPTGAEIRPADNSDAQFLLWLHNRLVYQHKENPNVDYLHKLRSIILSMPNNRATPNSTSSIEDLG